MHSEKPKLYKPFALRNAKIVYNFRLFGCNRVNCSSVLLLSEFKIIIKLDRVLLTILYVKKTVSCNTKRRAPFNLKFITY